MKVQFRRLRFVYVALATLTLVLAVAFWLLTPPHVIKVCPIVNPASDILQQCGYLSVEPRIITSIEGASRGRVSHSLFGPLRSYEMEAFVSMDRANLEVGVPEMSVWVRYDSREITQVSLAISSYRSDRMISDAKNIKRQRLLGQCQKEFWLLDRRAGDYLYALSYDADHQEHGLYASDLDTMRHRVTVAATSPTFSRSFVEHSPAIFDLMATFDPGWRIEPRLGLELPGVSRPPRTYEPHFPRVNIRDRDKQHRLFRKYSPPIDDLIDSLLGILTRDESTTCSL